MFSVLKWHQEYYFLKSARESYAEANVSGTTVSNNLTPYGYETDVYSKNPFVAATAESFLYAGRACYLQKKLDKATEYAQKAFELIPEFLQAGFEQAKYLASNNKELESVNLLEKVISSDRFFSIKTVKDKDLITKKKTTELLEKLRTDSHNEVKTKLDELKEKASKTSEANEILSEISKHLSKGNYLSNMKALDLLNSKYDLPYYQNSSKNKDRGHFDYFNVIRQKTQQQLYLNEFLNKENSSTQEFTNLKEKLKRELTIDKVKSYAIIGGILGIVAGLFKGCASGYDFWSASSWISTILTLAIISALIGYVIANSTNIKVEYR